jgi:hypothetical protein
VAGKTAPDCIPSVWRPSTFWCYEVRDQVTIIAGALISAMTSAYGVLAFYRRFTLGRQRLNALDVDLKHFRKPVEVLATAFLIDKVIKLHKRKDDITIQTLWRDLPFDQDMDKDVDSLIEAKLGKYLEDAHHLIEAKLGKYLEDVDHLIDARLNIHFSFLQANKKSSNVDTPNLDNLALLFREHVKASDRKFQQQLGASRSNYNGSDDSRKHCHPADAAISNAGIEFTQLQKLSSPLNEVVELRHLDIRHLPTTDALQEHCRHPSTSNGELASSSTIFLVETRASMPF